MEKRTKARLKSKPRKAVKKKVSKKKVIKLKKVVRRKVLKKKIIKKKPVRKSKPKIKSRVKSRSKIKKLARRSKPISTRPLTTDLWDKSRNIKIKNKEDSLDAFVKTVKEVEKKKYSFKEGSFDMGSYYVVNEENRNGSSFVHIVPSEAYSVFSEIKEKMPNMIIGFSILCGKNRMRDLRVSCFGISSSELTKALIRG